MTPEENARRVAEIQQEQAERRDRAKAYIRDGWADRDIARELGVLKGTVAGWRLQMRARQE